ncbi:hypothetical protein AVEN_110378-1 [Araneus ventricosus]|uniref:Uncharacterized protein n=1 Tax=Araneus ventricosus TaxID=182803 RepID=A0A4Y2EKS9_ARAVE|nr:hypothetical protein AVEN_110378-1 [Araneus ventricosus]
MTRLKGETCEPVHRDAALKSWTFTIRLFYSIWTNNRFVFNTFESIHMGGSFTKAPKRTNGCVDSPTPPTVSFPHGGFSLFGEITLPARFLQSDSHAHSPLQRSPPHG